jgi:type I site-specific restriction endonuclease
VDSETPVTIETLLGYVRNDIATLREDNLRQHGEIVHRLDTLNGRVHKHDREIDSIEAKVGEIHAMAESVKTIEQNYLTKTQGWTAFTFLAGGGSAVILWLLDRVIK